MNDLFVSLNNRSVASIKTYEYADRTWLASDVGREISFDPKFNELWNTYDRYFAFMGELS